MRAVCGIPYKDDKILVCKRSNNGPFSGMWEFPAEFVEKNDTLEDALERGFFERLSVLPQKKIFLGAINTNYYRETRLYGYFVRINKKIYLSGYDKCNWVNINKLTKYKMVPHSVIFIKFLKNCLDCV